MITGEWKNAVIANAGTESSEVDIGRPYETLLIIIPGVTSCQLSLKVAEKSGGTFQSLGSAAKTDSTVGGYTDVWEVGGFQFIKVVSSAAQGAARTFRVCGIRS